MNPFLPCLLTSLLTAQVETAPVLTGAEWPAYRGNAGLSGMSADDSIRPPFKLAWSYRLDGDAAGDAGAGVTVAGGNVYVNVHNTRSIVALDAGTGRFKWEYKEEPIGYMTVPTYADGRLLLWQRQPRKAAIIVLDAATGKLLWQQPLKAEGISPYQRDGLPVIDGKVFCSEGGAAPAVVAFDAKTGKLQWRTELGNDDGAFARCPVVAGNKVFVMTCTGFAWRKDSAGATVALDAASGKVLWRRRDVTAGGALVSDGRVVACVPRPFESNFRLLDAQNGDTLWQANLGEHGRVSVTPDMLLIKPYGADIIAVERQTGKRLWRFSGRCGSGCCSPSVAGRHAYMETGVPNGYGDLEAPWAFSYDKADPRANGISGTMHAIDLKTGKSVWHFSTGNTICGEPALAYGRLYFHSRDGNVYCFEQARKGEPTTPEAKDKSEPVSPETVAALLDSKHADRPRPGKDWPMLGGNADRVGLELPTLSLPLESAWKFDSGGRIVGSAAIRDGKVFVGSDSGKIHAVDLKTGRPVWEFATGGAVRCSPMVAGGLVYCGSDAGDFFALDADTGRKRWTFAAGGAIRGSPVISRGVVLFGANDHNLYALDRFTGKKLWSFRAADYCVQIPPVVHGDRVFCAQWAEWVYALDLTTGKELWRSYSPISVEALAYHKDKLWMRNLHYLVELDPATGKRLRLGDATWGWGGMAFHKNKLFVSGIQSQGGTSGATATDLDQEGRDIGKWTLEGVQRIRSKELLGWPQLAAMGTPLVVGDHLCFAAVTGKLYLTDPDGKVRWTTQLGGTCHATPVAADGVLIVGCDDGQLYAFRERGK